MRKLEVCHRSCHHPKAVAQALVGAEKSLGDKMDKFAGCNCYYLLVGAL
jgi:hypothetical protein